MQGERAYPSVCYCKTPVVLQNTKLRHRLRYWRRPHCSANSNEILATALFSCSIREGSKRAAGRGRLCGSGSAGGTNCAHMHFDHDIRMWNSVEMALGNAYNPELADIAQPLQDVQHVQDLAFVYSANIIIHSVKCGGTWPFHIQRWYK